MSTARRHPRDSVDRRLAAYSAVAGVVLAAPNLAAADEVVIPVNQTIMGAGSIDIDFDQDSDPEFRVFANSAGFQYTDFLNDGLGTDIGLGAVQEFGYAKPLGPNYLVSSGRSFVGNVYLSSSSAPSGPWYKTLAFVGVQFQLSGNTHYGWIRLEFGPDTGDNHFVTVHDIGYETTIGGSIMTPPSLPVELTAFAAVADGADSARLSWETASEVNNAGFEIEHRPVISNSGAFRAVGFVSDQGSTTAGASYTFVVHGLSPGRHAFRLKQIDADGTFVHSPTVELVLDVPDTHLLSRVFPNPVAGHAELSVIVKQEQYVSIRVYDGTGRQVARLYDGGLQAATAKAVSIEANALPTGLYVIRVVGEHFADTRKFVVSR